MFKAPETDYEWLYKNKMFKGIYYSNWKKTGQIPPFIRYTKRYAYRKFREELKAIPIDRVRNLSDIIERATYAKVNAGFGHGKSYWDKFKFIDLNRGVGA